MARRIRNVYKKASLNQLTIVMGIANLLRLEPFKYKRKGDSEQLLQDFTRY